MYFCTPKGSQKNKKMKKSLVVLSLSCLLAVGCKNMSSATVKVEDDTEAGVSEAAPAITEEEEAEADIMDELMGEEPLPVSVDELFDDFIFNFASNRQLQMERIAFPLTINSGTHKDTIGRESWQMEHFFMNDGEYTLLFDNQEQMELMKDTTLNEAIVEKIFLEEEFIRQYLFDRNDGKWMLREIRNQTLPKNPNASFIDFYHYFVTDSVFQRESLSDEIDFVGPDPDNDFSQMEGIITPDFWDAFAPELPQRMLFNIVYGHQDPAADEKIFVLRGIANGQELELTFRREDNHWRLKKLME